MKEDDEQLPLLWSVVAMGKGKGNEGGKMKVTTAGGQR